MGKPTTGNTGQHDLMTATRCDDWHWGNWPLLLMLNMDSLGLRKRLIFKYIFLYKSKKKYETV